MLKDLYGGMNLMARPRAGQQPRSGGNQDHGVREVMEMARNHGTLALILSGSRRGDEVG